MAIHTSQKGMLHRICAAFFCILVNWVDPLLGTVFFQVFTVCTGCAECIHSKENISCPDFFHKGDSIDIQIAHICDINIRERIGETGNQRISIAVLYNDQCASIFDICRNMGDFSSPPIKTRYQLTGSTLSRSISRLPSLGFVKSVS